MNPLLASSLAVMLSVLAGLSRPAPPAPAWTPSPAPSPTAVLELPPNAYSPSSIPNRPTPPASALITDFTGHPQALGLSCESRSAVDWAGYFGHPLGEIAFFKRLPVSGDPDLGFVGSVNGAWGQVPPNPYGVHAGPVARLLQDLGVPAYYHLYTPWATVQAEIAAGRPVMVWVTGHVAAGEGQIYTAPGGHRTVVAPFEHTVIVVGYDRETVTISDEGRQYRRFLSTFFAAWNPLRDMAITATP